MSASKCFLVYEAPTRYKNYCYSILESQNDKATGYFSSGIRVARLVWDIMICNTCGRAVNVNWPAGDLTGWKKENKNKYFESLFVYTD